MPPRAGLAEDRHPVPRFSPRLLRGVRFSPTIYGYVLPPVGVFPNPLGSCTASPSVVSFRFRNDHNRYRRRARLSRLGIGFWPFRNGGLILRPGFNLTAVIWMAAFGLLWGRAVFFDRKGSVPAGLFAVTS